MMMGSRETFVNYTMPLGLHHLIGGNHYAPMPQNAKAQRADWTATYYHQAVDDGHRLRPHDEREQGRRAVLPASPRHVRQTWRPARRQFLLWFHRCAWDYKLKSGKTLWDGTL